MTRPKEPWCCQRCSARGVILRRATPRSKICKWCADELAAAGQRWCTSGRHAASDWSGPKATMCRACQKARNAAYRQTHREEVLAANRAWYVAHRDERLVYNQAYHQANRLSILAQKKGYYQQNCERLKAAARAHHLRRSPASIAKERARWRARRPIYMANRRAAAMRRKFELWRRMIGQEAT